MCRGRAATTRPASALTRFDGAIGVDAGALALLRTGPALRAGSVLAADQPTTAYLQSSRTGVVQHYLRRDPSERFYGLGNKTGPLNLAGRRLRTAATDALGYDAERSDPLYKFWPFVLSRTPDGHWVGLYYDTLATCTFNFGCEHDNDHGLYRYVEIDDGDLDVYVMAVAAPRDVVALIGGTHLPPRWSLGYAQTAMGLTDAHDRLCAFAAAAHRMPVSAFHLGSGYSMRGRRRHVFQWDRARFRNPSVLTAAFHSAGMRVIANVQPCLFDDHLDFGALGGGLIADGRTGTGPLHLSTSHIPRRCASSQLCVFVDHQRTAALGMSVTVGTTPLCTAWLSF